MNTSKCWNLIRCGIINGILVANCNKYLGSLFVKLLTGNSSTVVITGAGIIGGSWLLFGSLKDVKIA